jgi:AraC-like DNA-binding protein
MTLHYKYNMHHACKVILKEQLQKLGISFRISGIGEIQIDDELQAERFKKLEDALKKYGIEIIDDHKDTIVHQVKEVITELVYMDEKLPDSKVSSYLAKKLNYSYSYIARVFSEVTHTSIQNYLILQRIERAKQMIIEDKMTLTEVAWKMNYSSAAHLSNQFKKTTGLTPTVFQKIIEKRSRMFQV